MSEVAQEVRAGSGKGKIWGIIVLLLGLFSIAVPFLPGLGVVLMIGAALVVTGIAQFAYVFQSDSFGRGVLRFAFGLLALMAGVSLLSQPGAGLATITLFLAAWFIVDGIWALIAGFGARPAPGSGWMVFSGIVSIVLGVMIYNQFPESAVWLVGVLVGIRLVFAGLTMIMLGSVGKAVANQIDEAAGDS